MNCQNSLHVLLFMLLPYTFLDNILVLYFSEPNLLMQNKSFKVKLLHIHQCYPYQNAECDTARKIRVRRCVG